MVQCFQPEEPLLWIMNHRGHYRQPRTHPPSSPNFLRPSLVTKNPNRFIFRYTVGVLIIVELFSDILSLLANHIDLAARSSPLACFSTTQSLFRMCAARVVDVARSGRLGATLKTHERIEARKNAPASASPPILNEC